MLQPEAALGGVMTQRDTRVIVFFAYRSSSEVICTDVDACVIAGSEQATRDFVIETDPASARTTTIKKTRFGEILSGLQLGAAYAFDRESYSRFFPLAREAGLPVSQADFEQQDRQGNRFFTVRIVTE